MIAMLVMAGIAQAADGVRDATPKELAAIKTGMETSLKDAGSAKLQNIRFKGETFCGLVNAKNSYGAYTGYVPITGMVFDVDGKKVAAVMGLSSPEATRSVCEEKGLPLPPT